MAELNSTLPTTLESLRTHVEYLLRYPLIRLAIF